MGWTFDKPLYSMTTEEQNKEAQDVWESESLGGIMEDNNRLPQPVVGLLILTIITAFLVTFPLWGQRPNAAMYLPYVEMMDTPEVKNIPDDAKKMEYMFDKVKSSGSKWIPLLERHPISMDGLRLIKNDIIELKNAHKHLQEYNVLGNHLHIANFEGNKWPDGSTKREQPWWDLGYTIDIFFIIIFCTAVMITVKRLPPSTFKPDHSKAH